MGGKKIEPQTPVETIAKAIIDGLIKILTPLIKNGKK
jgi:hypothetical protein